MLANKSTLQIVTVALLTGITSPTGAVPLGTCQMNGAIGINTSRPPTPDGVGPCYDCTHHQGYLTMKFTVPPYNLSSVFAEYHYHTLPMYSQYCDQQDPCIIDFESLGVLDGIYLSRCSLPSTNSPKVATPGQ